MNDPAAPATRRPSAPSLLPVVLAIALLIPMAVLFGQVWSDLDDERSAAARERDGIAYLRALGPVTVALVDAQSAAVTGQPVPDETLDRAVREAADVDARIGGKLRTTERWAGLRSRIESLPARPTGSVRERLTAYQEATDLLLALYAKVRSSSGLVRDPDADAAQLQQAVARDLPAVLVGTGRLADAVALAPARPASDRLATAADLTAARLATFAPAQDLVADLQEAIDSTQSTNLGANLLSRLDAYQRALGALSAAVAPPDETPATGTRARELPDPATVATARATAQSAGADLATIILAELDTLVEERTRQVDTRRWAALAAAAAALLLTIVLVIHSVVARRRHRRALALAAREAIAEEAGIERPGPASRPSTGSATGTPTRNGERWRLAADPTPEHRRDAPAPEWPEPMPVGPNTRTAVGTVRDNQPAHWGRTDAAR